MDERPIGLFDSGIGGLTVFAAVRQELPAEQVVYLGDTARCPYGDRSPAEVVLYTRACLDYLYSLGVKALVVACNSATAAALPELKGRYEVPVIGVIQPGVRAAIQASGRKTIGVIGTTMTIASGAYQREIQARLPEAKVVAVACPAFVPLVEQGVWDGPLAEDVVRRSLAPLLAEPVDALILGCTHYPLLGAVIQRVMGPQVVLISSAAETAREVRDVLHKAGRAAKDRVPRHLFLTTGEPAMLARALVEWVGLPAAQAVVHQVRLDPDAPVAADPVAFGTPASSAGGEAKPRTNPHPHRPWPRPAVGHSFP
ncbi:glutamate racemase [Alicyclobacillus cellulosilyticus]|uniref:glutamate racemase n=1 Tax=Alicyclobacillus cellulosilyticus TaxID=1003997 RepID=UPI001E5A90C0|nr:glutamate racemase [Alicyclobacillus cellulosilyticus]